VSFLASACAQASALETENPHATTAPQTTTIAQIPNEIMLSIFSYLGTKDMVSADQVCKGWHELLEEEHGQMPTLTAALFEPVLTHNTPKMPDDLVVTGLEHLMTKKAFAPLAHVLLSPDLYPQGTRLLNASDLAEHTDILNTWYTALFGNEPQDAHTLTLVMATIPQILVHDQMSEATLNQLTPYLQKVGRANSFVRFTGNETEKNLDSFQKASHIIVVREDDLLTHKDALSTILHTRDDHRVVLCLDGDTLIQNSSLNISKDHIPENLLHLTLADPFGKASAIGHHFLWFHPSITSVNLRGLPNITSLGESLLDGCMNLKLLTIGDPSKITTVGQCVLAGVTLSEQDQARFNTLLTRVRG